jgi:hypothetical protein
MSRVLVLLLSSLVFAVAAQAAESDRDGEIADAAKIAQCELGGPWAADLHAMPGDTKTDLRIVATVAEDDKEDGSLCVGVVRATDSRFTKVALLNQRIRVPKDVDPVTNYYVSVDSVPFRYSPADVAFAVRVTEEFNSTSTNFHTTELYLFRRDGDRVVEIFHANVGEGLIDKTSNSSQNSEKIIKFSPHATSGGYDLIVAPKHGGKSQRFQWNGSRYIAAP